MSDWRLNIVAAAVIGSFSLGFFLANSGMASAQNDTTSTVSAVTPSPGSTTQSAITYSPPDMTGISAAELRRYFKWRHKMDWLLAPIHTRADLKLYLKKHAKSGSPLDALPPDAKQRFLESLEFGRYGVFAPNYSDLQYLSTIQVYKILALFGEQGKAVMFTGGKIRAASPQAQSTPGKPSRIAQRFSQYLKATQFRRGETHAQRSKRVAQFYDRWFAAMQTPNSVHKLGNHDLRLLFRSAHLATLYTSDPKYAQDARMDFAEMVKRDFAGPPDYEQMYAALVRTRQFSAAHKFHEDHPDADLTPFPAYRDEANNVGENAPTILIVSTTQNELIRHSVNLDKSAQVLILTDPHCHFCAYFNEALQSYPKLRATLQQHSLWVTPPGSELEFATLQAWNRAHPHQQLAILYSLHGWPMIETLAIPQFFFLRNGVVVAHEMGWNEGTMSHIKSGLKAIGLQ